MTDASQLALIGLVAAGTIAALAWERARPAAGEVARARLLGVLAVLAVLAWTDLGGFRGHGGFVQEWDMFHYQLPAKYFPELGYDGLYPASLAAQAETRPEMGLPPVTRDARSDLIVPTRSLRPVAEEVESRFTPERWASFLRDNDHYVQALLASAGPAAVAQLRCDHGLNASPAWIRVARWCGAGLPVVPAALTFLALLDVLLLLVVLLAVLRSFGRRIACLCVIVFGTGHAWAFAWSGGCFLRLDWLAAIALAACALKSRRPAIAGGLLGYAAIVKIFPLAFLLGPVVVGVREWRAGRTPGPVARLLGGFSLALAGGLAAGCAAGGGAHAWLDFAHKVQRHAAASLTIDVGAGAVLPAGAGLVASLALLALAVLAAWRLPLDESVVLGVVGVFAVTPIACYYWVMLSLVPLVRGRWMTAAIVALSAGSHGLDRLAGASETRIFGALSWGLLVAFLAWLAWIARRTSRPTGAPLSAEPLETVETPRA